MVAGGSTGTAGVLIILLAALGVAKSEVVTFEQLPADTLVRDHFRAFGLRITGAGPFSGRLFDEGTSGVLNFGNSAVRVLHIGARDEATTLTFVDPENLASVVGATAVSFRIGDGDSDAETLEVTYRSVSGGILKGPTSYSTITSGLSLYESRATLGAVIGSVEIRLSASSESGMVIDDVSFRLNVPEDGYNFVSIEEVPSAPSESFEFSSPAINELGQLAYQVSGASGTGEVRLGSGGVPTTIATAGSGQFTDFGPLLQPDVNDQGQVVFFANTVFGSQGYWVGDGSEIEEVVESTDGFGCFACGGNGGSIRQEASIAMDGSVYFSGADDSGVGIFRWSSGLPVALIRRQIPGIISFQPMLQVNQNGLIAFVGQHTHVGTVVAVGDGSSPVREIWLDDSGFSVLHGPVALNDAGRVALLLEFSPPMRLEIQLRDTVGVMTSKVVVDSNGPFGALDSSRFSLNDLDEVAFWATPDIGASGIWTSRNLASPVVRHGDPLFGSTAAWVAPGNRSLNELGEIAFAFELTDGRRGVGKAVPIGECANGNDDDGDGAADLADPGCDGLADTRERSLARPCDDSLDNDGDGLIDFPGDPQCGGLDSTSEVPEPSLGISLFTGISTLARFVRRRR